MITPEERQAIERRNVAWQVRRTDHPVVRNANQAAWDRRSLLHELELMEIRLEGEQSRGRLTRIELHELKNPKHHTTAIGLSVGCEMIEKYQCSCGWTA